MFTRAIVTKKYGDRAATHVAFIDLKDKPETAPFKHENFHTS